MSQHINLRWLRTQLPNQMCKISFKLVMTEDKPFLVGFFHMSVFLIEVDCISSCRDWKRCTNLSTVRLIPLAGCEMSWSAGGGGFFKKLNST